MNRSFTVQENDCIEGNEQNQAEIIQVMNLLYFSSQGSCFHCLSVISSADVNATVVVVAIVDDDNLAVNLFIKIIIIHQVVVISLAIRSSNQHRDCDYLLMCCAYDFKGKASEIAVIVSHTERAVSDHRNLAAICFSYTRCLVAHAF